MSSSLTIQTVEVPLGVIVHPTTGEVLITQFTPAFVDKYGIVFATPGGRKEDTDQTLQSALKRELEPQLGVSVTVHALIGTMNVPTKAALEIASYFLCGLSAYPDSFSSDFRKEKYAGQLWVPPHLTQIYRTHSHPDVQRVILGQQSNP